MPRGGNFFLLYQNLAADGAHAALRETGSRAGRIFPGERFRLMGGKFAVLKRFRARCSAGGTALIIDCPLFARRRRDEVFCFRTLHPGMRRGGNYARLNVRRIVVADALLLARCCASRSLRLRPFAPAVPRGGNFFLCFQDGTADGALFAVRQTRLRTGRRLPGDHLERMIGLFHRHLLAAEFFFANRAVDDFFIRALRRACCGDLVFLDRLSRRMGGGDDFLFREDDAADGALAAFRKTGGKAGRSLPRDYHGRMRSHRDILRALCIAARTCIGANARCRTGGRRRHRTAAPCMAEGCRLHMLARYFFLADRTIDDLVIRARLRTSRSLFVFLFRL